ncbi:class I SAM-dependent methyltransferase [Paraburkholderia sp.]|jgi:ubiquinone/menaquinone biosynthesis C-methylase UbiE|uniref:class I SAM-dependent methyltransferase n=1 Tax=Paraburkholderia sp. TaxID=1926495 RepID=UPI002F425003
MKALSPTETYLQDFHQRMAGATSAAFAQLPGHSSTAQYASSYAALAACVPDTNAPLTALDLACGDGHLLKLLSDRQCPSLRLIGVDMSQGELELARAALPEHVVLLQERAQHVSIETGSVDHVISHMALMLMEDIDQVVSEIRRVLRPQGEFAAIVGRSFMLGEANQVFMDVFRPIAREGLVPLPFGDARARSATGWTELLQRDFKNVHFEDIDLAWAPRPEALWASLLETYDIDRMSASAKERLWVALLEAWTPLLQSDGTLDTGWGVSLIRAQAA